MVELNQVRPPPLLGAAATLAHLTDSATPGLGVHMNRQAAATPGLGVHMNRPAAATPGLGVHMSRQAAATPGLGVHMTSEVSAWLRGSTKSYLVN